MTNPQDSTDGATPLKEEAARLMAEVGGVRSSDDPVPDLHWVGQTTGERRDATCSAEVKRNEGCGDGFAGVPGPKKVWKLENPVYWKAQSSPGYRFWSLYGEVQRA